eukprot:COSAG01_NODE_856_length_13082_cov_23.882009_2_plen_74_part_00
MWVGVCDGIRCGVAQCSMAQAASTATFQRGMSAALPRCEAVRGTSTRIAYREAWAEPCEWVSVTAYGVVSRSV